MIANVLLEISKLDKTFTYKIPKHMEEKCRVGMRVLVPFANRQLEGFVMGIEEEKKTDYSLKDILSLIDEEEVLNSELLKLGNYIHNKTLCTLISAYQTMLPTSLKARKDNIAKVKTVIYLKQVKEYIPTTEKEAEVLDLFIGDKEVSKKEANEISSYVVKKLLEKGILFSFEKEIYRLQDSSIQIQENITLTEEQKQVLSSVSLKEFHPYLLHGVTGSGKTEVYMQLIEQALALGKEAIVLVPEISLTPQLVHTFRKRFGEQIAILHSRLSKGEKYDEWRKISRKEVKIVIGARSAIFAPFTNLGIIILDEEHSSTYKQENNPRYHAIDVAIWRSKYHNCPIILGSATPSIESYTRAKTGIYTLLEMKSRVNQMLPSTYLVDMKIEMKQKRFIFSKLLQDKIQEKLEKQEQIILLLNRRGYSTIVTCPECGYTHKCPACDIPLTYHLTKHKMICHYCNYETDKLTTCPDCHSHRLNERGMGTEKLEEEVKKLFPTARVVRMDVDTTSNKSAHQKIISAFENHEYDILIGTQMIAKGLDFPLVTLVGVMNGDATLNIPDYRSGERTFELLNQVAGRAGRSSLKGEVIIQGFNIDHYSIRLASKHDYVSFYQEEMRIRKILKYPPFYNLCVIKIEGKNQETVEKEADKIAHYLNQHLQGEILLGPAPGLFPKINHTYFYQVILKYKDTKKIMEPLQFIRNQYLKNNQVLVNIDFNPNRA